MIKNLRPNGYESFDIFKISYLWLTFFFVFIYLSIFIGFVLFIRLQRFGFSLDLKPWIFLIRFIYIQQDYLILILLLLVVINSLFFLAGILKRIQDFFLLQLLKIHTYLFYQTSLYDVDYYTEEFIKTLSPRQDLLFNYSLYRRFIRFVEENANVSDLKDRILWLWILIELFFQDTKYYKHIENITFSSKKKLNIILDIRYNVISLLFLVFYDLIFNDLIIVKLFYFLPFYFLYVLWYKFIKFQFFERAYYLYDLAFILYEMYYKQDTIQYFRLNKSDGMLIGLYIRAGLTGADDYFNTDAMSDAYRIRHYSRYVLVDEEKQLFFNSAIKDYIRLPKKNK